MSIKRPPATGDDPKAARREPGRRGARSPLARFLVRRVLTALLLAVGITLVTFVLTNLVPGDPVAANLGQRALGDPAIVAQWRTEHGLDKPLPEQYLLHLRGVVQGDLGTSQQSHRPVMDDLADSVPATLELAGAAILISIVAAPDQPPVRRPGVPGRGGRAESHPRAARTL
ncbi:ABC transporter permease, partial [Streptosporangium sandarakinum]